jgi:NAD-dependent dihydropyrimidine dehydrogenase PreA subunit
VAQNNAAVDEALAHLHQVNVPSAASSDWERAPIVPELCAEFIRSVTARIIEGLGDDLPVSAMPVDGTYPVGTTKWEKRNIATEIPVWDEDICIQCGKCVFVCPHAVMRMKVYDPALAEDAPGNLQIGTGPLQRVQGSLLYPSGCARRLHRLYPLCRCLPGEKQAAAKTQGNQHGPASHRCAKANGKIGSSSSTCPK